MIEKIDPNFLLQAGYVSYLLFLQIAEISVVFLEKYFKAKNHCLSYALPKPIKSPQKSKEKITCESLPVKASLNKAHDKEAAKRFVRKTTQFRFIV